MEEPPVTPVRILGDEYLIRGASAERVRELAAFVDEKFQSISARAPGQDLRRLAVLVSLNLAEEVFAERERQSTVSGDVLRRIERCRTRLEAGLAPGDPEA